MSDATANDVEIASVEPSESRRSLLKKGAAAAAAVAAVGVVGARRAEAANGDPILIGGSGVGTSTTSLSGSSFSVTAGTYSVSGVGGAAIAGYDGNPQFSSGSVGVFGKVDGTFGRGVYGLATDSSGFGIYGEATGTGGTGVYGTGTNSGVTGTGFIGVNGSGLYGVFGTGSLGTVGQGTAVGLFGQGSGVNGASLGLAEASAVPNVPPSSGTWQAGSFLVKSGALWYCYIGGGGTSSKWVKISSALKQVSPPIRAYDSRTSSGGPGPILGGQTRTIGLSASGVPAGSTAALINLQLINTVTSGFLSVYSASIPSSPPPGFSTIQWSSSGQRLANEVTVAVNPSAQIKVYGGGRTNFFIDVVGYYP